MAKKKPTPSDDRPEPRGRSRPEPPIGEAGMGSLPPASSAGRRKSEPGTSGRGSGSSPLEQARKLAARAAEALEPRQQIALAKQALETSPDCAEAYVLLADHAKTRKEALKLLEQAVEAAGRDLGPEIFQKGEGHFWGLLETRPYMRVRLGLAEALWSAGRRDEAAGHLSEMLRLNPGDNQGVRYILASWLLNLERVDELDALLDRYDEDSTTWAFTRALAAFRKSADSPASRKLLQAAKKSQQARRRLHPGSKVAARRVTPVLQPGSRGRRDPLRRRQPLRLEVDPRRGRLAPLQGEGSSETEGRPSGPGRPLGRSVRTAQETSQRSGRLAG